MDAAQVGLWATVAMATAAVGALALGEYRRAQEDTRRQVADAKVDAGGDATLKSELGTLSRAIERLAGSQEALNTRFGSHETSDAGFQGTIAAEMRGMTAAFEKMATASIASNEQLTRRVDQIAAQVSRLMPPADTFTELTAHKKSANG